MAIGLFTVPHDIGFGGVFDAAFSSSAPQHGRALAGVLLIFIGLLFGAVGSVMVAATSQPTDKTE
jgi:hypothetical protein